MNEAWHPILGRVVLADELWGIENPQKQPWQCCTCSRHLIAAACDITRRKEFKVRPYFRADGTHECDAKVEDLMRKGQVRSVLQEQNLPISVFDKLKLDNHFEKQLSDLGVGQGEVHLKQDYRRTASTLLPSAQRHSRVATTVRPLCAQYINFPHDRRHPLLVPGVNGGTYWDVFQPIRFLKKDSDPIPSLKIFIGEVMFKHPPAMSEDGNILIVTLRDEIRTRMPVGHAAAAYQLHINMDGWSPRARAGLQQDIRLAQQEARTAFIERSPERPWIFFLGAQDAQNPSQFHVADRRLVCCFTKAITWFSASPAPKFPRNDKD